MANPTDLLTHAAERMRLFNHQSLIITNNWNHPEHAYAALGDMTQLAQMMSQAIGQVTVPATLAVEKGKIAVEGENDPQTAVQELYAATAEAQVLADQLAAAVLRLWTAASPLSLRSEES